MVDVAVIPGDGIGKEIIPEVCRVINNINDEINFIYYDISSERYLNKGITVTDNEISELKSYRAILFGAIGDFRIKPGIMEQEVILRLRKDLDLYMNIRPVMSMPNVSKYNNLNITIYRENKEDFYSLINGTLDNDMEFRHSDALNNYDIKISGTSNDKLNYNLGILTEKNITRFFRKAYELIEDDNIVITDKANAISMYLFWREIAKNESSKFNKNIKFEYADSLAYNIILHPEKYKHIIAPNLYGDILSDMTSALAGSLGYAASGNIGDKNAMFEPVHGSAPDIAGKGIANPIAGVLSGSMLLDYLGYKKDAQRIKNIINQMLQNKIIPVESGGNAGTHDIIKYILNEK
ncbi:3-isopropylmalate dehydrogenase, partial [Acidiplasma aeolicum]